MYKLRVGSIKKRKLGMLLTGTKLVGDAASLISYTRRLRKHTVKGVITRMVDSEVLLLHFFVALS